MSQIPPKLIFLVVIAIASLAFMALGSLCASIFLHTYADPAILTAVITITGGLVGSLGTILSSPRSQPQDIATTQTTTTTPKATPPLVTSGTPAPVVIQQPADKPIPVTETTKPESQT